MKILKHLSQTAFDLCILDFRLGSQDGLQIFKSIKNSGLSIPVIFLTGQGDQKVAVLAMKEGLLIILSKGALRRKTSPNPLQNLF